MSPPPRMDCWRLLSAASELNAGERKTLAMGRKLRHPEQFYASPYGYGVAGALEMTQECEPDRFVRWLDRQMPNPPKPEILVQQSGPRRRCGHG